MLAPRATSQDALIGQAVQLLRAGRKLDAISLLRQAAGVDPGNATVQHDLGLACLETGQPAEAAAALQRAVTIKPKFANAWFRLGVALETLGDARGAVVAYDRATSLLPSLTEAWFRAGALVFTLGHKNEAIGCFRRAASSGPKTSYGKMGKARALLAEARDAEAERVLRQILALDASNPMALDLLGNLLADAGRFDEARDYFAHAIENAPLMAGAYYDLVRCRRLTASDSDLLPRIEAALATPGLAPPQRLRVHLALGKAADDLGDLALAMRQFDAADAVRRALAPFDAAAFDTQVNRLIERFTPDLLARATEIGSPESTPLLILGMPRSGTTLLEQILSCHPDVTGGGELNFWNERGIAWHQTDPAGDPAPFVAKAAADYLAELRGIDAKVAHVSDKMPFNFLWAGLIHLAFPRATLLHCRRAAIDTAISIHQTHFNPRVAFPTGGPELVAYFRAYERLTAHWRRVLPASRFVEVDYEALTASPEASIRRVTEACGLAWHDAVLTPERNARLVRTPSKWQARQPIHRGAVERWRRYEPWLGVLRELK